jgi:lipid II:glycine glycyltransferase (peptidoglycan interpeptide bridge formation enzyme)
MHLSFIQSPEWGTFQQSVGLKTFRVNGVLLIAKPLPFGKSYLYCPHLDFRFQNSDFRIFLNKVKELAKEGQVVFLRLEPTEELKIENCKLKIVRSSDVQPSKTLILDLKKSEEGLLAAMHPKTRYNIRLAEKRGVKVYEAGEDKFEKFWNLMQETTGRDKFHSHDKTYYQKMLAGEMVKLYFAEYKNEVLAAGLFVFYGDTVTYLHGASTQEHKEVMAPYALHWQMIQLAKQLGYAKYDFYGIDEQKWPGVTRFKKGFGGNEVNYPGCYDVVFDKKWYIAYKLIRRVRQIF